MGKIYYGRLSQQAIFVLLLGTRLADATDFALD